MDVVEFIQSTQNARVKQWRKLHTKKGRDQSGTYLVEGHHLVEEAIKQGDIIEFIIQEGVEETYIPEDVPRFRVSDAVTKAISTTETSQGVFAVCRKRSTTIQTDRHQRFLLIDRVQDPGNIGTMIRTAEAVGVDVIVLGDGTVDLYNPKVIRSAQGSHFYTQITTGNLLEWIDELHHAGVPVYGTALQDAIEYENVSPSESFALLVGNEGAGIRSDLLKKTTKNIYVPIYGKSESLNVAIATSILLYHLRK